MNLGFQFVESVRSSFAFGACESHVGMIGTGLGDESAKARRSSDTLLQCPQFRRETNACEKNSSALKETQALQLNRNGGRTELA